MACTTSVDPRPMSVLLGMFTGPAIHPGKDDAGMTPFLVWTKRDLPRRGNQGRGGGRRGEGFDPDKRDYPKLDSYSSSAFYLVTALRPTYLT